MKKTNLMLCSSHPATPLRERLRLTIRIPCGEDVYWDIYTTMDAWVHQDKRHAHFIVDDLGERYDPNR